MRPSVLFGKKIGGGAECYTESVLIEPHFHTQKTISQSYKH